MIPLLLINVITSLVVDKAQTLAKEHVEEMIKQIIPKEAVGILDGIVKMDKTQSADTMIELIESGVSSYTGDTADDCLTLDITIGYNPMTNKIVLAPKV